MFCEPAVLNFYSCFITHGGSLFILTMCTIWIKSSEELFESIAFTITVSGTVQSTTECWESHLSTCQHSHLVPVNQGEKTVTKSLRFLFSYEFTMKTVYIIQTFLFTCHGLLNDDKFNIFMTSTQGIRCC